MIPSAGFGTISFLCQFLKQIVVESIIDDWLAKLRIKLIYF